jgi:transcriptional regulator with XRE-family HTH domain
LVATKPVPERQTSEERRAAARESRTRWASEVRQALAERSLSVHAAARQAGISPGALQAWLNQDVEPAPRAMRELARVIGRSHLRLVSLLGWLPEELQAVPNQLEATFKIREALAEAGRWVEAATVSVSVSGGSLIANAVLEASSDWEVILRHSIRGRRHQVRYVTDVAFSRVGSLDRHTPATASIDIDNDRAEVERLLAGVFRRTGAYWRRPERTADYSWIRRPDLVLSVPVLRASKPRGLRPNLVVPPSIVVAGIPYAGAPDVGALLATSLDWEYNDLRASAQERFGTVLGSPDEIAAQTETARLLLEEMTPAAGRRVWAYDDVEPLVQTLPSIGPELPLVVFLRAPDSIVRYAAEQSPRSISARQMEVAQNQVRGIVEGLIEKHKERAVILDLPELPIEQGKLHDLDLFFDAYVELAFQGVRWLKEFHGGPSLDQAQGILGALWRAAHSNDDAIAPR